MELAHAPSTHTFPPLCMKPAREVRIKESFAHNFGSKPINLNENVDQMYRNVVPEIYYMLKITDIIYVSQRYIVKGF